MNSLDYNPEAFLRDCAKREEGGWEHPSVGRSRVWSRSLRSGLRSGPMGPPWHEH
jgi:hypothetical protein